MYEIPNYSQVDEEVENVIKDLLQDAREMTNNQSFTFNFDALNEMIENSARDIDITLGDIIANQPPGMTSSQNTSSGSLKTATSSPLLQVPAASSPTSSNNGASSGNTANNSAHTSPQLERTRSQVQLAQRRSIPNLPPIDSILQLQQLQNGSATPTNNTSLSPTSAGSGMSPNVNTPTSRSQSPGKPINTCVG